MGSMDWYAFRAFDEKTQYGFGTASEAARYLNQLNFDRELNSFSSDKLTRHQVVALKLDDGGVGFSLLGIFGVERK